MNWFVVSLVISSLSCRQVTTVTICPVDEVFNRCGSACTPTCETPVIPCTLQCVARCECPTGKVKNADGLCVDLASCPIKPACGPFERFTQCGGCEPTCENPFPVICPAVCLERCECLPGFVRDSNGRCVLLDECSTPECPLDEVFKQCGSACTPTCDDPFPECTEQCVARCECPSGQVKNQFNICVPLDECNVLPPKVCPLGDPLPDVFCGRGPGRKDCDPGYFCRIDPADRFALCCPESDKGSSSEDEDSSSSENSDSSSFDRSDASEY